MRISDWSSDVCSSDLIGDHLAGPRKGFVDAPQRTARVAVRQRRLARSGIALAPLPRAVDAQHEEGQPARADPLQRGQPVRDLFEPGAEAPLEQQDRKSTRLNSSP